MTSYTMKNKRTGETLLTHEGKPQIVSKQTKESYERLYESLGIDTFEEFQFERLEVLDQEANDREMW